MWMRQSCHYVTEEHPNIQQTAAEPLLHGTASLRAGVEAAAGCTTWE